MQTNKTIDEHFKELKRAGEGNSLEKRLSQMATEASKTREGALENPTTIWKRRPAELKGVRKYGFGRHRVFYTGKNTDCSYLAIYVKIFKRSGVDDEDDPTFHRVLIKALKESPTRVLNPDDDPDKP